MTSVNANMSGGQSTSSSSTSRPATASQVDSIVGRAEPTVVLCVVVLGSTSCVDMAFTPTGTSRDGVEEVGVDQSVLAFYGETGPRFDVGAGGKPPVGFRADQHPADRCLTFEPGPDVDRVADHGIDQIAGSAQLADEGVAAIDTDPEFGPLRVLRGEWTHLALKLEAGAS